MTDAYLLIDVLRDNLLVVPVGQCSSMFRRRILLEADAEGPEGSLRLLQKQAKAAKGCCERCGCRETL